MGFKTFDRQIFDCQSRVESRLCVGLDPDLDRLPHFFKLGNSKRAVADFCRAIIDHTAPFVCAFKPQFAHFSAIGAENELQELIAYIHENFPGLQVIFDAKRGDIGSTAERYAVEAFQRYGADSVTVNPYFGFDALEPFLNYPGKGVFVLCRTSNESAHELQDQLLVQGDPLYSLVAQLVAKKWSEYRSLGLVVGATQLDAIQNIARTASSIPLLIPGFGEQNGDLEKVIANLCQNGHVGPVLVSASRSVIYADSGRNFAKAAGSVAKRLRDDVNNFFDKYMLKR